jgi:hypothetical protein
MNGQQLKTILAPLVERMDKILAEQRKTVKLLGELVGMQHETLEMQREPLMELHQAQVVQRMHRMQEATTEQPVVEEEGPVVEEEGVFHKLLAILTNRGDSTNRGGSMNR